MQLDNVVVPAENAVATDPRAILDPEMTAALLAHAKDEKKEAAVKHSRHWVRLTRLCNQRCIFCLDSWNHNGTYIDTQQLFQYIDLGVALGRERLILSGGEPTIHPDYVKFIRRGRAAGYDWVQTVSNGMMFAYPEFTRKCIQAGLDEVTISIHGHTPKIQDRLCGVKGAFDKALQGIRNIRALSGGKTVVNIDIVINKQNVMHLREIIDLFRGMDIHEFDLLYIVPFGRGFAEYRSQLYFDIDAHFDDLQRAFEVSREPGVFIWTNRLPVRHLEGFEDLIQDPHKLHSEVQGGLHNFEGFLKLGVAPDCHGERCDFCFLKQLCHDRMFDYRARLTDGTFEHLRLDLDVPIAGPRAAQALALQAPQAVHLQASDADAIRSWRAEAAYSEADLIVETRDGVASVADLLAQDDLARVVIADLATLNAALAIAPLAEGPALEVALNADLAARILEGGFGVEAWIGAGRLVGRLVNHEYLSEVKDAGVTPEHLGALAEAGVRLMNVTRCIGGEGAEEDRHFELSRAMLDAQGNLGVTPYVQRYIMGEYMKKSLRCRPCVFHDNCRGMHINYLRAHGFRILTPILPAASALLEIGNAAHPS